MTYSHVIVQKTTKDGVNVAGTGTRCLRAGRLRVGREQRTRVMTQCLDTLGGLDWWYNFDLSVSVGISNS